MQSWLLSLVPDRGHVQAFAADGARVLKEEINIGGPDGWDYATFDATTRTVYIAHGSAIASRQRVDESRKRSSGRVPRVRISPSLRRRHDAADHSR